MATTKKEKDEYTALLQKMKPAQIRFVTLYLGGEDGKCFNNATLAYIRAFDIQCRTTKDAKGEYDKKYLSAKQMGYALLTKVDIQRLKHNMLLEQGFKPENIKKRYAELANQNKNLPIALTATDRMAKIAGVIADDPTKVDIPQLTELTEHIKNILTPKR